MQKKMAHYLFFFRRFWAKEPRHSETISDENCYLCRSLRPTPFGVFGEIYRRGPRVRCPRKKTGLLRIGLPLLAVIHNILTFLTTLPQSCHRGALRPVFRTMG